MEGAAFAVVFLIIYIAIILFSLALGITMYVLNSLGMYTIAKRRNISNPILAWIPVANVWLLGCIADHYDEAVKGVKKKSRVVLLSLYIAYLAVLFIFMAFMMVFVIVCIANSSDYETVAVGFIIVMVLGYFIIFAMAIAVLVFEYIAYYKLFKSCHPNNALIYLILSIFVSASIPIIIFMCRNDDKGLPIPETIVE